ncbi:hypothetical protein FBQ96_02165 [Nitrospirales bacterium NOB]|nr:MAG: hypothetical protein UZ03_NOB001003131 [Nitrospira sp. OLB3]MBV6471344.1 hypothetical protein [Nitrospirota bacterium]MCE7966560.1 hypothetical protein [Nitrospira sp. NTP2]MDL1888385.1 hypothetical protein [Nitrospirales bacterium NOB]RIK60871.1 MAG: hypothetical protein DCC63_01560 [Nitrospira sp.]
MSTNICFIYTYTWNPINETKRLAYLKRLINECHRRGIHAIMDGVFNHADATPPDRGFPYYWLYQDPADSPYVGNFAQAAFFQDLDYANTCSTNSTDRSSLFISAA